MSTAASSPITSRPPAVEFTNRFVQPPSGLYVFRDDLLFVRSISRSVSLELRLRGRLLTPKGEIVSLEFVHTSAAGGFDPAFETFILQEGFFLGLSLLSPISTITRGTTFLICGITRGGVEPGAISQLLFADYLEGLKSPSWPQGGIESPVSGPGRLFPFSSADPAAGGEISFTVVVNSRLRPVAVNFELVTDATVTNRLVKLEVLTGGTRLVLAPADAVQIASTTISYTGGHFGGRGSGLGGALLIPLPDHLILQDGDVIRTETDGLQAGDDFGAATVYAEDWVQE